MFSRSYASGIVSDAVSLSWGQDLPVLVPALPITCTSVSLLWVWKFWPLTLGMTYAYDRRLDITLLRSLKPVLLRAAVSS